MRLATEIAPANKSPVSDFHTTLLSIERRFDAKRLNEIVNDPAVFPWVRGSADGDIDLTFAVENPANVLLMGEHGAMLLIQHQQGLFEAHTQVLPVGRGQWAVDFAKACVFWMFTRTNCFELMTKCPHGNLGARALARCVGGKKLFTNPRGWTKDGKVIPADIFGLTIQDWMLTAQGLEERGHWFHERLMSEYRRLGRREAPHPDDSVHDRYVGMACEMFLGGQPQKAVVLYNRWAVMADYLPIDLMSLQPVAINIHDAVIVMRKDSFYVATLTGTGDVH
jgi:hypothetical protein